MNRIAASTGHNMQITDSGQTTSQRPHKRRRKVIVRIGTAIIVVLILAFGWVGGKFIINSVRIFGWDGVLNMFDSRPLNGEREGRVNILLAGNSTDDPGHEGAQLTDSIMILSINTRAHSGYILSIPRDLYVDIPGDGYAKINEVYEKGESSSVSILGNPEGGMGLLKQIISRDLDIDVHYYALINYTAMRKAVDAVGGIDLRIESSDERGLYDPSPDLSNDGQPLVNLPNGMVHLNGLQSLNVARARGRAPGAYGYEGGDFMRTKLQRQILIALKRKAVSIGMISNPVRMGQLFDSFGGNVRTDMEMNEVRRLYALAKSIDDERIISAGLEDKPLLKDHVTHRGQYALVPQAGIDNYSEIRGYIRSLEETN